MILNRDAPKAHFGGHLTKKGNIGRQTQAAQRFVTAALLEKLVRFDIASAQGAALSDIDIATVLHRSVRTLLSLRKRSDYLAKRIELTTGIPASAEASVDYAIAHQRAYLRDSVPAALRVLVDTLLSKPLDNAGKKIQIAVAQDLLDREGSLAKISKTEQKVQVEHNFEELDQVSSDILAALGEAPQAPLSSEEDSLRITSLIEQNQKFSNTSQLSPEAQAAAMETLQIVDENSQIDPKMLN